MIEKNTTVPTNKTQTFSTAADNQPSVEVHILQGERPMAADNKTLGRFILDGIPPAPRGVPQVEVSFDIDANGILNVSAKDKASGKSQSVRIEASTALSKEEIEKLKNDAQAHAAEDAKRRELVEARNLGETLAYSAEKALKDAGDKVPADVQTSVEEKIKAVRDVLAGEDVAAIKNASDALSSEMQKIGEAVYKQEPTPPTDSSAGTEPGTPSGDEGAPAA
jgi:molecular chaperone DnaK